MEYFNLTTTAKRKKSFSKILITNGNGKILINNILFDIFFKNFEDKKKYFLKMFNLFPFINEYNFFIQIKGGGIYSQVDLVLLSISKIISYLNIKIKKKLSHLGALHQDSRQKERRKYGCKKARKKSQYSKR